MQGSTLNKQNCEADPGVVFSGGSIIFYVRTKCSWRHEDPEAIKIFHARIFRQALAFGFVLISVLFWPLHFRADWKGDEYLADLAFGCMVAALALGYCVPRTDRQRFLPAALALWVFVAHGSPASYESHFREGCGMR